MDASGNAFVSGVFWGGVDFDPSTKTKFVYSGASYNGFVLKLTSAGKFSWVSPFVGKKVGSLSGYSFPESLTLDPSGNVITGGWYGNTVDFNPGSGTTNLPTNGGGFIVKLTGSSGSLVWRGRW